MIERLRGGAGASGFTLIEVIGALVIFSVGVLMVIQVSGSLSNQMQYAAVTSELVVRGQEQLDSLEATPFDSLTTGTAVDSLIISGAAYTQTVSVTTVTALLYQLDVTILPRSGGPGPSFAATSYSALPW